MLTAYRIFDPIGFSSSLSQVIITKDLGIKTGWGDEVQKEIKEAFLNWIIEIPIIFDMIVPRRLFNSTVSCNGSQLVYATAILMRSEAYNGVNVQLVRAQSRFPLLDE